MRRRWFFFIGVLLFFAGLWVIGAKPGELVPNEGGRETASEFLKAAISPALDFEDPEMRESEVDFIHKLGRALWLTLRYAVAAMSLALLIGIIWGVLGSRAWWSKSSLFLQTIRIGSRLMATAVRSVHELMWALLFLSAVGTSPLAAVLAMALPYGGTLAKVFSELLDESESSAAGVIRMSGGSGLAAFSAGVVTRALPDLATYALYRLECAIRSSAVLGFVGVPTLGYEIKTAYEDGHYREIWTYLYILLAVVIFFEWWGAKMRSLLTKGVASKKPEVKQPNVDHLWKSRGTSLFLRSSFLIVLIGGTMSWLLEDRWGSGVSWEQKIQNLDRFTDEVVPYPVREADGDWSEFGPWFGEKMSKGGSEAVWQTFHLGTASILLAGALAILAVSLSARTLASSMPRGVWDRGMAWRPVIGAMLRVAAMLGRAMPEFILAFLLLRVFGPTVWALILALVVHNCGILIRLGAEVIDNTPSRASSVILAQGGSRTSAYVGALVPAGFTRIVLFLFYRWESCIREATVLGMLGVASLGFLISDAKVSLFYDEMVLWVALGAALVFLGDLTSDFVRYKLRGKNNR